MSGGFFNYEQYKLFYLADEIEQIIIDAKKEWEDINVLSFDIRYDLSKEMFPN